MVKKIGLITSGGDGPGMNAAIRAVVRTAIFHQLEVVAFLKGYTGIIQNKVLKMDASSVGNILQRGGTIIQTSRCPEFFELSGRKKAFENLRSQKVDVLIVIGGDGSFNGAQKLYEETQFPVIGIPGTIDNDISSTDYTIGHDTAVQTAIDAVDRIRDTASSHSRNFLIEVMGRSSSAIAIKVAVSTGAENVLLPHGPVDYKKITEDISRGIERGKNSSINIVAEGKEAGRSYEIQKVLKEQYQTKTRVCILGHIQRGGNPVIRDRFVASEMGHLAIQAVLQKKFQTVTVVQKGETLLAPLKDCLQKKDEVDPKYIQLAHTLSI